MTLPNPRVLIFADDLSGAADCAAPFAASGLKTVVQWGRQLQDDAEVVAIDTGTRRLPPDRAAEEVARLARTFVRGAGQILYKKIDSTLRGNIRVETAAALAALRVLNPDAKLLVAPAFPEQGRITKGKQQHVNGVRVETDLPGLFEGGAQIFDAESEEDLAALAASAPRDALWVGSAGLGRQLARSFAQQSTRLPRLMGPILFVVGSDSPVSRTQADVLSRQPGIQDVCFDPTSAKATPVTIRGDVLVRLPERISMDQDAARFALAYFLAPHVERAGALVMTGGDTARAVLDTIGVTGLRVWGEIEPGVPLSISVGSWVRPVVTKAGGFGSTSTLMHCREVLKSSKLK